MPSLEPIPEFDLYAELLFLVSAIVAMFGGVDVGVWVLIGAVCRRFNN